MTTSNPFTKRDWGSLLRDDAEETNTFSSDEVNALKARVGVAESHEELSAKASSLVSDIVSSQNKKLVLIGESSHGTAEFYETRAHITRQLIEEKKCFAILLEADMPPFMCCSSPICDGRRPHHSPNHASLYTQISQLDVGKRRIPIVCNLVARLQQVPG
jgi:hypothetical protein